VLTVDHCHATGKVRGVLCRRHNLALGQVQDSIAELEALIAYLREGTGIEVPTRVVPDIDYSARDREIRELRGVQGLTCAAIAKRYGLSPSRVETICTGVQRAPRPTSRKQAS
jgi:hypothetical protein